MLRWWPTSGRFWDQYSGINRDEELQEYRRLLEKQVAYASGYPDGLSSVARPKPPGADDIDFPGPQRPQSLLERGHSLPDPGLPPYREWMT